MPHVDPVLYNALLQSRQGGLTELTGGHRVYPQCHCCISGNTVGVYKDPVPILEVSDQDVCTYESLSVSFSNSFSASSTLQMYSVDWGDGYNSNGAWPPPASIAHPSGHGYVLPGNYVIILTVTDLLGATGMAAVDVYVDDCWVPLGFLPGEFPPIADQPTTQVYCTERWGPRHYYTGNITATPPAWTQLNTGLALDKTVVMPSLTTNRFFGYCQGIWEYTPLPIGAGAWNAVLTEAQIATLFGHGGDYVSAVIGKMIFSVNPSHEEWAWASVVVNWNDGDDHYLYGVVFTTDAWTSTQYARTVVELDEGTDFDDYVVCLERMDLAYDEHADYLYTVICKGPENDGGAPAVATIDGWWRLYRSQDYGYTWILSQSQTYTWGPDNYPIDMGDLECSVWVPWGSETYNGGTLFWTVCMLQETNLVWDYLTIPLIYRSQNFGLSYFNISDDGGGQPGCALNVLHGPHNSIHRVYGTLAFSDNANTRQGEVWTWRESHGWSLFRDANPTVEDCSDMLIMEQNGYALQKVVTFSDPYRVTAGAAVDLQQPDDDAYDFTWVET